MPKVTINDSNAHLWINPVVDGDRKAHGLIPRDFRACPVGYLRAAPPFSLPLIPENEWPDRLREQQSMKSSCVDIRNTGMNGERIPSRDQNGRGYCWFHSGVSAHLVVRAAMHEAYADLSAYAGACIIKNYRDEGGWGSEGVEWQAENGCPTSEYWPQQATDRKYDTPAMRLNAKLHRYTRYMDLDPRKMKAQLATCYLLGLPTINDYNRWSHSVAGMRISKLSPFSHDIWNSWGDGWSEDGIGELEGESWLPNAALVCLVVTPSLLVHLRDHRIPHSAVC